MPTKEHGSFSLSFFSFSSSPFREAAAPRNSMATSLQRVVIHRNRENPGSVVSWGFSTPAGRTHELPTPLVNRFITDRLDFSALVKCTGFRGDRLSLAEANQPASHPRLAVDWRKIRVTKPRSAPARFRVRFQVQRGGGWKAAEEFREIARKTRLTGCYPITDGGVYVRCI